MMLLAWGAEHCYYHIGTKTWFKFMGRGIRLPASPADQYPVSAQKEVEGVGGRSLYLEQDHQSEFVTTKQTCSTTPGEIKQGQSITLSATILNFVG